MSNQTILQLRICTDCGGIKNDAELHLCSCDAPTLSRKGTFVRQPSPTEETPSASARAEHQSPAAGDHLCELCGAPMPRGEEMFRYHGHSGPCPAPAAGDHAEGA